MRSIEINLASRPFRNDTPVVTGLVILIALTLGFTGYNGYTYFTADSRLSSLEQQLTDHQGKMRQFQAEAERLKAELEKVDMSTLQPQAEFVNGVLRERNFSWTRLFNALENVLPWDVRLISVRPMFEGADVMIEITAVARNHESYLGLQTVLHESPFFDKVVPAGFEAEQAQSNRVFFEMRCRYLPEAVSEPEIQQAESEDGTGSGQDGATEEEAGSGAVPEAPQAEPQPAPDEVEQEPPPAETAKTGQDGRSRRGGA